MYRIHQIKLDIGQPREMIPAKIAKALGIKDLRISQWHIVRESLDARDKKHIRWIYTVDFETERKLHLPAANGRTASGRTANGRAANGRGKNAPRLELAPQEQYEQPLLPPALLTSYDSADLPPEKRPLVIGFGPAGIFAALILAQAGLRPLVLERGRDVDSRTADVESFWQGGPLKPESNVQFGEGGAGAFSDGKLTTGIKDARIHKVLAELVRFGAPPEIMYRQRPHVGTDILRTVVKNIRHEIIRLGGEICFETRLSGLIAAGGRLTAITCEGPAAAEQLRAAEDCRHLAAGRLPCRRLILAPGHSARDTFAMLREAGAAMEQKPFSIGVRIEHPQEMIDIAQYGRPAAELGLPPAEYKLSWRCPQDAGLAAGRGVYTFCMCPGGQVINAASEENGVVVNGMSLHARDSGWANSALLCDVRVSDFGSDDVLAGVEFQRRYETLAYQAAGRRLTPPAATWGALRDGKAPQVEGCLPDFALAAFRLAMPQLGRRLQGFDSDEARIYAVETRSSSPVRILRGGDGQSLTIGGLYPCGEGAGYAGGITSAAVDGIKAAEALIRDLIAEDEAGVTPAGL